jgi:hypothetical protein
LIAEVETAWKEFLVSTLGQWLGSEGAEGWEALLKKVEAGGGPSAQEVPKFDMWIKSAVR